MGASLHLPRVQSSCCCVDFVGYGQVVLLVVLMLLVVAWGVVLLLLLLKLRNGNGITQF